MEDDRKAFHDQLRAQTCASAVVAGWIVLFVYPAWSLFDQELLPERASSFIAVRLAGEVLIFGVWAALRSPRVGPRWTEPLAFALFAVPTVSIAWMLPHTPPELEAYVLGFSAVIYGTVVVLICRWQLGVAFVALAWASTVLFAVLAPEHLTQRDVAVMAAYLTTAGTVAVVAQAHRHRSAWRQFLTQSELERQQERNAALVAELHHLSRQDGLTGISNRRGWDEWIQREVHRARRAGCPLGVIFGDIDLLKEVNDRLGHAAGDAVIRSAAGLLLGRVRASDFVARVGGDEFVIGCPDTDLTGVIELADQLAADARSDRWPDGLPVTMSFGVAEVLPDDAGPDEVMKRADAALYRAKVTRGAVSL